MTIQILDNPTDANPVITGSADPVVVFGLFSGQWGYPQARRIPVEIQVWVGIGPAGEMVNITAWLDRYTADVTVTEDQEGRKSTFKVNFLQEVGNQYDIPSKVPVWVYDTATLNFDGSYMRVFSGFTYSPDAETPGVPTERFIGIQAVGMEELAENPPRTVVDWPPADGSPVVATNTNATISPGLNVTIEPVDTHNMYVGKTLYLTEPVAEYPHQERVIVGDTNLAVRHTVASSFVNGTHTVTPDSMAGLVAGERYFMCNKNGHNPETATISNVTGTTFDVTLTIGKSANWLILPGTITLDEVTHTYTYSHTTVAAPALSGINIVVAPASLTNLQQGTLVTVRNSDGTSAEVSELLAVNPTGGGGGGGGLSADVFGVSTHLMRHSTTGSIAELNLFASQGLGYVRTDISWRLMEPSVKGTYATALFTQVKSILARAQILGLHITLTPIEVPGWANGNTGSFHPPTTRQDYADFVGHLASECSAYVGTFDIEIWNEPDETVFWTTGPNASDYTDMLSRSYTAIKAVSASIPVLGGSLSHNDQTFLSAMLTAGAGAKMDSVAMHPYCGNRSPTDTSNTARSFTLTITDTRATLDAAGLTAMPIALTEFGYTTQGTGSVTESTRATYLGAVPAIVAAETVTSLVVRHAVFTPSLQNTEAPGYILLNSNSTPKVSYQAYLDAVAAEVAGGGGGTGTVTLDLQTAKTAGWYMDVLPLVGGPITVVELYKDGWEQEIAGQLVHVDGVLDTCYTNATPSYTVDKGGIDDDVQLIFGVLKYEAATPAQINRDMLKYAPVIDTVVDSSATAGGVITVTPRSNLGIIQSKTLTVYNDDGSNYEQAKVLTWNRASFTIQLSTAKDAGWHIRGFVIPRVYHNVISDNAAHNAPWTYILHLYDAAAPTNLTAFEISDEDPTIFDPATQVRFKSYKLNHTGDGKQNRQTVRGKNFALGSYQDDTDINGLPGRVGIGRAIEPPPVSLDFVFTNEQAEAEAKKIVWRNNRDFVQLDVSTPSCIDNYVLTEPKWGTVILPYEPESPFNLPLVNVHVTFPEGNAYYDYTYGDPRQLYGISPVTAEEVAGIKTAVTFMHQVLVTDEEYHARYAGTTYLIDASNNDVTVYMPTALSDPTRRVEFKCINDGDGAHTVSIVAAANELVK